MAVPRTLDIRWVRRYRLFCIGGCVILAIQVFLAFKFINIDSYNESSGQDLLSGRGRLSLEIFEDRGSVESSRRFRENYLGFDDEDDEPNMENDAAGYHKIKVPPDKLVRIDPQKHEYNQVPKKKITSTVANDKNKTRLTVLRVEELDFVPMCEITNKEAVSAVHRARTQYCKQEIVNTTCLIYSGDLYPPSLPHYCPAPGLKRGKLLGCYQDDKTRLLGGYYSNNKLNNSPSLCINVCLQSGFPYAGVEYGSECFCGEDEPAVSARLPDSSCNMKCPGDRKEACGGYYTANIYQTGVARWTPQGSREASPLEDNSPDRVKIVFLLTLNGRAVRQVKRLIKALFHRDHYFYIHVDARQDYMLRELMSVEMRLNNVRLSRRRHSTIWGGSSLLTMLLQAFSELTHSDWRWDFVINLSETDFPVKTNKALVEFLTANKDLNFVKSHGHETQRFIQKQGLDKTFVECEAHMWRAGDRQLPEGIVLDGGSDWLALSRQFVDYLTSPPLDPLIQGLISLFKNTLLPAESFFHTVLRNSIYCETYVDNNLHVTNWRRRLGCKCQYKHIVDWCGCSPNNFKLQDWGRLQGTESKSLYFARKFEPIISQDIINQLDEWLYGPYPHNLTGLNSYWQSVYHYADLSPQADDALVTVGYALSRLTASRLDNCTSKLSPSKLLTITSYHYQDRYEGSLVQFESRAKGRKDNVRLESWVTPLDSYKVIKNIGPVPRIKRLLVSSDFDQKEETWRNTLRATGPYAELMAIAQVVTYSPSTEQINMTLVWVDPTGSVADVSELPIEDTPSTSFSKAGLRTPMLPGVWDVYLVWNLTVLAKTSFLIVPLQSISNSPLSTRQAEFIHGGPGERYPKQTVDWFNVLSISKEGNRLAARRAASNSRRVGKDLIQWIDQLVTRFYRVDAICLSDEESKDEFCGSSLPRCKQTAWSSFSPDPKSDINSIDKQTGRINRW